MRRRYSCVLSFPVALILLVIAWTMVVPLGAAQDEDAHYVKALGTGRGELVGLPPAQLFGPIFRRLSTAALRHQLQHPRRQTPAEARQGRTLAWAFSTGRDFLVPTRLVQNFDCLNLTDYTSTSRPLRCRRVSASTPSSHGVTRVGSHVGTYPPWPYLVPGALMQAASDPTGAYWIGRFASAAIALFVLVLAVAASWRPRAGPLSLLGLMVTVTPMTVYMCSVLNPNGLEIAGAVCFGASLFRITGSPSPAPIAAWLGCATGGVVLALTRPLGPVFVVLISLAAGCLAERRHLVAVWRANRGAVFETGLAIVLALGLALVWQRHEPGYQASLSAVIDGLGSSITALPTILRQAVGMFVSDLLLPWYANALWAAMVVALLAASAAVAAPGERIRLAGLAIVTLGTLVVLLDLIIQNTGVTYGRYIFPLLVPLPLYGTSILAERGERLTVAVRRRLVASIVIAATFVQALAWWENARRIAVGTDGPHFFLSHAQWKPPGGWLPWAALAAAGTVSYLLGTARPRTSPGGATPMTFLRGLFNTSGSKAG